MSALAMQRTKWPALAIQGKICTAWIAVLPRSSPRRVGLCPHGARETRENENTSPRTASGFRIPVSCTSFPLTPRFDATELEVIKIIINAPTTHSFPRPISLPLKLNASNNCVTPARLQYNTRRNDFSHLLSLRFAFTVYVFSIYRDA
ncbi:hypothetical protein SUGI_0560140 [Cryptomeria japonica]|nr:hypothetical protein SUGI_0560140 [Cryptomeria japonica]